VACPGLDQRWQLGRDGLGAEPPPLSQGPLGTLRMRRSAHNLAQPRRERPVAWAETPGGGGARPRRAGGASPPLCGAGRVAAPLPRLGPALRQAVGLAAPALGTAAAAGVAEAGWSRVAPRRLQAARALAWGEPRARERALGLGREAGARWPRGRAPPPPLAAAPPPLQEGREPIPPRSPQDTEPAPGSGPGGRRRKPPVAPERRLSSAATARRHGRNSRAKTCHGFHAPWAGAWASNVIREVGGRPATEPEPEAGARLAAAVAHAPGLRQLDSALGALARPWRAPGAAPGGDMSARPWPGSGPRCPTQDCSGDGAHGPVTGPGGQPGPLPPGRTVAWPAWAGAPCPPRAPGPTAPRGQGRPLTSRADAQCQQKRRAQLRPKRGRASRRNRTTGEHAMAQQWAHQGRRARYNGWRKHPLDGRRPAALSNLQVAAPYEEEPRRAS
jgi:hypothetical protein